MPGAPIGPAPGGHHPGRAAEDHGLRHRPVRQEPSGRPRRVPAAPCTASTSSSATSTTSTPTRISKTRTDPTDPAFRKKFDPRGVICGHGRSRRHADGRGHRPAHQERMETVRRRDSSAPPLDYLDRRARGRASRSSSGTTRRAMHVRSSICRTWAGESRPGSGRLRRRPAPSTTPRSARSWASSTNSASPRTPSSSTPPTTAPTQYMWPEGGISPFRGDKGTTWEGGVRRALRHPLARRAGSARERGRSSPHGPGSRPWRPPPASRTSWRSCSRVRPRRPRLSGPSRRLRPDRRCSGQVGALGRAMSSSTMTRRCSRRSATSSSRSPSPRRTATAGTSPLLKPAAGRGSSTCCMDPFERQTGDLNRQMNEHKAWVLTPLVRHRRRRISRPSRTSRSASSASAPTSARRSRGCSRNCSGCSRRTERGNGTCRPE